MALLQDQGYDVRTSGCSSPGHPILGQLEKDLPDVILVDVGIPYKGETVDKGGWDCLLRLKARKATQHIPIIAYTIQSNLSQELRIKLEELGVPLLRYPFDMAIFVDALEKSIG